MCEREGVYLRANKCTWICVNEWRVWMRLLAQMGANVYVWMYAIVPMLLQITCKRFSSCLQHARVFNMLISYPLFSLFFLFPSVFHHDLIGSYPPPGWRSRCLRKGSHWLFFQLPLFQYSRSYNTPLLLTHTPLIVQVVEGMDVVRKMESVPVDSEDCPRTPVVIANCGQL